MTYEQFSDRTMKLLVALIFASVLTTVTPAVAGENRDKAVVEALTERTQTFCSAVLPAWFAAEQGISAPEVRSSVADCYTGHARLAVLGVDSGLSLDGMGLAEVPAVLIRMETGMNLDIYRPLAGRTIRIEPLGN